MKHCLLILSMIFTLSAFSQNTTQDEYNFMTKGYQQLVESGLDMKRGYELADTMSFVTQGQKYGFTFMNLIRQKDKSLAGTIVVAESYGWSRKYYLGMIAAGEDLSVDHEKTLMVQIAGFGWDSNIKTAFLQALSEYMSFIMTGAYMQKGKSNTRARS